MEFNGFPSGAIDFLLNLEANNDPVWFNANKADYERLIKTPSQEFVLAMGEEIHKFSPEVQAVPQVNKTMFRLNRDIRFSKDKRPYKTHIAFCFWQGESRKTSPCYYFHFSAREIIYGIGSMGYDKDQLTNFRDMLVHPKTGNEFNKIAKSLVKSGYNLDGKGYKTVPRGYPADHPNAEYLMFKWLHGGLTTPMNDLLFSGDLIAECGKHYRKFEPLLNWLALV